MSLNCSPNSSHKWGFFYDLNKVLKMKKFKIFEAATYIALEEIVNYHLSFGWEIQGSVCFFQDKYTIAMVKS